MKKIILNYLYRQVLGSLREMDASQLKELKSRLHAFNASSCKWDSPNVRKPKSAEVDA